MRIIDIFIISKLGFIVGNPQKVKSDYKKDYCLKKKVIFVHYFVTHVAWIAMDYERVSPVAVKLVIQNYKGLMNFKLFANY